MSNPSFTLLIYLKYFRQILDSKIIENTVLQNNLILTKKNCDGINTILMII